MHSIDPGEPLPIDVIDAGDTASPPADIFDSFHLLDPQIVSGVIEPSYVGVNDNLAINPGRGIAVYIRVGGTTTQATMQIPGTQPYTGANRDDLVLAGLQNTERVFYMPDLLIEPEGEVAIASFSQTAGVTAAVVQVR